MKNIKLMIAVIIFAMPVFLTAQATQKKEAANAGKADIQPVGNIQSAVSKSTATVKKDYHIEVEKDKEGRRLNVKFISPKGKVMKNLPYKRGALLKGTLIPKIGKYVLYTPEEYMGNIGREKVNKQGYLSYSISLYDVKGDVKWKKEFKTYPRYMGIEGAENPFDNGISDNGERIYANYCDEKSTYTLTVFDAAGKEVISLRHNILLYEIEISPDGKIVGAWTVKDGAKHLFFLEVDTGKTKLVKAEGDKGYGDASPSAATKVDKTYEPLIGYITVYWNPKLGGPTKAKFVKFVDLPDDLSELFQERGEEK